LYFAGTTTRIKSPNPTTCKPTITAAIPPARRHSDGDIERLIRSNLDVHDDDTDNGSTRSSLLGWVSDRPCSSA
jgi:hypothetical protein